MKSVEFVCSFMQNVSLLCKDKNQNITAHLLKLCQNEFKFKLYKLFHKVKKGLLHQLISKLDIQNSLFVSFAIFRFFCMDV